MPGWARAAAKVKINVYPEGGGTSVDAPKAGPPKDASSPLGISSLRNIMSLLDRGAPGGDEELARRAIEVEEERQRRLKRDEELEDAKLKSQRAQRERDERRLNVKKGVRTHPQLRQLDVLALELQANETEKRTKYLEWRRDILDAEEMHVMDPGRFDEHVEKIHEKIKRLARTEQELAIVAKEVERQKEIEEAVFAQLQQEAKAKNAAAEQEYKERQKLKLLSQRAAANARERAKEEAKKAEEEQRRRKLNAVIQRWNGQTVAFFFYPWAEHAAQVGRVKELALTALKRWLSASTAKVFELWTHRVSQARAIKEIARNIVGRWMQQGLALAFQSWNDYVLKEYNLSEVLCSLAERLGAAHRRSHRRVLANEWGAEQQLMASEEDLARGGTEQVGTTAEQRLLASAEEVAEGCAEQAVMDKEPGQQTLSAKLGPTRHAKLKVNVPTSSSVATNQFWVDGESPGQQLHSQGIPLVRIYQTQQEAREQQGYSARQQVSPELSSNHTAVPDKHVPVIEELRASTIEHPERHSNEGDVHHGKYLGTLSATFAKSRRDDRTKASDGKVPSTPPGMERDTSATPTKATSSRGKNDHRDRSLFTSEKAQERQQQPSVQTLGIPITISTTSRAIPQHLSKGQRACTPVHFPFPPSYTGPTSPEVDRKRLHDWTRGGDGDPRSESFYFENGSLPDDSHASPLESGQVTSVVCEGAREVGVIDEPLLVDGLQSDGLESNRHVFRGQADSGQGHCAIQSVYKDLDEANKILERFCSKHMLPRSVAATGRQHQQAIELLLGHVEKTREPLILGVSGSVDFGKHDDSTAGQNAPSNLRGGVQLSSRAREVVAQFKQYLRSQAGGCVGWFLQICGDDGCLSAQDAVDELRRSCNLSTHDVLELVRSLCDPFSPHLIRLSTLWAVLCCPHFEDSPATGMVGGDIASTQAEVHLDDLDSVWKAIEEGDWNAQDEGLYLRRNPGMTREEFDREIIRLSKSAADKLDSILDSQEELELCIRLEAQLLQRDDEGTTEVFGDRIGKVRASQSLRMTRQPSSSMTL